MFVSPITVKCIRINPVFFHNHISMRIGLIGSLLQPGGGTSSCTTTTQLVTPIMTTQTTTVRPVTTTTDVSVSTADSRISSSTPSSNANSMQYVYFLNQKNKGFVILFPIYLFCMYARYVFTVTTTLRMSEKTSFFLNSSLYCLNF